MPKNARSNEYKIPKKIKKRYEEIKLVKYKNNNILVWNLKADKNKKY